MIDNRKIFLLEKDTKGYIVMRLTRVIKTGVVDSIQKCEFFGYRILRIDKERF